MSPIDRHLHDRSLELAASALDFGLDGAETAELEAHLAACPACARSSRALRLDAMALRLPATLLPSRRVDDAVYRAIAGRTLRSPTRVFVIMAAALLLLVALLGIAGAGASLLRNRPPVVLVPSPSAPALVVVNPSPSPAPQPSATSAPTMSEAPMPSPSPPSSPPPALPVTSGVVRMAPGPDGGLYAVVNGAPSGSLVALLAAGGASRPGWPVALDGWNCDGPNEPFVPVVASDDSVRLVCRSRELSDGPPTVRAFAFDPSGEPLPGWPVDLPGNAWDQPRIVGDQLVVAARESSAQEPYPGAYWLVEIAADGTVRTGSRYEIASDAANWPVAIGPDGIAYRRSADEVAAFDMDGLRPGWPVKPGGRPSAVAFDATSRVVVAVPGDAGTSRLMTLDRDGAVVRTSSALPFVGASPWSGAGPDGYPMAPLVAADGSAYVIGEADGRALLYRVDPSGTIPAGWPIRAATIWQWQGTCPFGITGCGVWRATPALDPDGAIYLPLAAPDPEIGGSLSAIGPEGSALPGWPVHLAGNGAEFWSIVAGSDGTVFALAVEPSTGGSTSATLLAIARDGTVRWRSTLVDPEGAR